MAAERGQARSARIAWGTPAPCCASRYPGSPRTYGRRCPQRCLRQRSVLGMTGRRGAQRLTDFGDGIRTPGDVTAIHSKPAHMGFVYRPRNPPGQTRTRVARSRPFTARRIPTSAARSSRRAVGIRTDPPPEPPRVPLREPRARCHLLPCTITSASPPEPRLNPVREDRNPAGSVSHG